MKSEIKEEVINFIVVDDDSINNNICEKIILKVFPQADVKTFINPDEALTYIKSARLNDQSKSTVLFLDINMPEMTGWEFLEVYDRFDPVIRKKITVYMLSSSVDFRDIDRAKENKIVNGFISKPLTKQIVQITATGTSYFPNSNSI